MINIKGYVGALVELLGFFSISFFFKCFIPVKYFNNVSYYWLCFTVLTGIWEIFYIKNHKNTIVYSAKLLNERKHVWFKKYNLRMILPWELSKIFYAEYGAYADREYMTEKDKWSLIIEGTHSFLCALFSTLAIISLFYENNKNFYLFLGISMGSQLMNSILYMGEYIIQTKNINNINYNNSDFPCGKFLIKRPFMWINIFWTIMPIYVIMNTIISID